MLLEYSEFKNNDLVAPKQIVLLLHGYGSNKEDLITIAPELSKYLPDACFVCPNAIEPYEGNFGSNAYQWFSLQNRMPEVMLENIKKAAPILSDFINELLLRFSLSVSDLAILGFSQGSMMTLYTGLRMVKPPKAMVGYSGMLIGAEVLPHEITSKPAILLIHGSEDQVVPIEKMQMAVSTLKNLNVPVSSHICRYLGHGIDYEGIKVAGEFLRANFQPNLVNNG